MKIKLITLTSLGVLALSGIAFSQDDQGQRGGGRGNRHISLERVTDQLNLTPEQKAKVQPIVDQATPQLESIRRDAMQKSKAVMDGALAQIRPLLTADQQKKLDEAQTSRGGGRGGRRGHHGHGGQESPDDQ